MEKDGIVKQRVRQKSSGLMSVAQHIKAVATWKHLGDSQSTLTALRNICNQVKNRSGATSRERTQSKGLFILFSGPYGTGKSMAAEVIANELARDLYRVELSAVASKYIGDTEKNIERVLSIANNKNCILFFDEADALFGKRTEVRDVHNQYAHIETNHLLQTMEEFDGLVILASKLTDAIDPAFLRRLRFVVNFPLPIR